MAFLIELIVSTLMNAVIEPCLVHDEDIYTPAIFLTPLAGLFARGYIRVIGTAVEE